MQVWFVSRLRENTVYQIAQVFYRHEGILDALVWVGSKHGPHAGHLMRLVRFSDGHILHMYLTKVLDPCQRSQPDIARLYAPSFDIELAFLTLKRELGLHIWWSSKRILIWQQILVVLVVAQLGQALRIEMAVQAGVDPFDVSLPLLVSYLPRLLARRQDPVRWVLTYGRHLGFIRASSRLQITAPEIPLEQMRFPPPHLRLTRPARYVEYKPRPRRPSSNKPKAAPKKE
jgi:hypothetical protein